VKNKRCGRPAVSNRRHCLYTQRTAAVVATQNDDRRRADNGGDCDLDDDPCNKSNNMITTAEHSVERIPSQRGTTIHRTGDTDHNPDSRDTGWITHGISPRQTLPLKLSIRKISISKSVSAILGCPALHTDLLTADTFSFEINLRKQSQIRLIKLL